MEIAATGEGGGRAGALHFMTTSRTDTRILRVRLYPQSSSWLASIAQHVALTAALGHELQHALEVHARASVRTAEDFATMYRAEGTRVRFKQGEEFEAVAALHIGRQVERELLGVPTAPALQPCTAL